MHPFAISPKKEPRIPRLDALKDIVQQPKGSAAGTYNATRYGHANHGQISCSAFVVSPACFPRYLSPTNPRNDEKHLWPRAARWHVLPVPVLHHVAVMSPRLSTSRSPAQPFILSSPCEFVFVPRCLPASACMRRFSSSSSRTCG